MPHDSAIQPAAPAVIDTHIWETGADGSRHRVRARTVGEVFDEIRAAVGDAPDGAEEYFSIAHSIHADMPWPVGRIAAFVVTGYSEGHYVHVEVLSGGPSQMLVLGKTFHGADAAWALARRLADLLGI